MSDPTGVLDQVRERVDNISYSDSLRDWHDLVHLLPPLVEALEAQDDFYAHSADCVDEDCREEERLEGIAMSKRHVALADLQEQLQEKAGD